MYIRINLRYVHWLLVTAAFEIVIEHQGIVTYFSSYAHMNILLKYCEVDVTTYSISRSVPPISVNNQSILIHIPIQAHSAIVTGSITTF